MKREIDFVVPENYFTDCLGDRMACTFEKHINIFNLNSKQLESIHGMWSVSQLDTLFASMVIGFPISSSVLYQLYKKFQRLYL